jgi:uncharacterized glyoxalase superfamily protein PhnB
MMTEPRPEASATVEVAVEPRRAFAVFTDEIDCWWVRGPINFFDAARAAAMRIEPGIGGRVLEVYDEARGDVLELGRITAWEPGALLAYRASVDDTAVEVRFEATNTGTRVHVRQYLVDGGDPGGASLFWPRVTWMFASWCTPAPSRPRRDVSRVHVELFYADPPEAARWLVRAFGLDSADARVPAPGESPSWVELRVGDVPIILSRLDGEWPAGAPLTHMTWVHVDDVDAHYTRAKAEGAAIVSEISQYGYRAYVAADPQGHQWTFAQARPTMGP